MVARFRGAALGFGLVAVATIPLGLLRDDGAAEPTPEPGPSNALDVVPGMGRTYEERGRDVVVAYAETLRREEAVAQCMAVEGFEYHPDVSFPPESVLEIAVGLGRIDRDLLTEFRSDQLEESRRGVTEVLLADDDPRRRNQIVVSALSGRTLDRYYLTLFGETADDVAEAERTGVAPAGRGEVFATGGCVGRAEQARSVWDLRTELMPIVEAEMRAQFDGPIMRKTGVEFRSCFEGAAGSTLEGEYGPGDIERAIADAKIDFDSGYASLEQCIGVWTAGMDELRDVVSNKIAETHKDAIDDATSYYESYVEELRARPFFVEYLDRHVRWVTSGVDAE